MATGVVADSFGGPGRGGRSTPPDYYSTFMSMRKKTPPSNQPKINDDETQKALSAVMQVFDKLQEKAGGQGDPNLDAARDAIKKYAASKKIDPATLTGEKPAAPQGDAAPPADTQTPPAPGSAGAQEAPAA